LHCDSSDHLVTNFALLVVFLIRFVTFDN